MSGWGGGGQDRGGGHWVGGQGGCERRSVAFVKIQKKNLGGGGWVGGSGTGGGRGGSDQGLGWGGSKAWGRGDVRYGGCKPRIKGIDKCK